MVICQFLVSSKQVNKLAIKQYIDESNTFKVTNDGIKMTSVKSFYYFIPNFEQIQHNNLLFSLFVLYTFCLNG